MLPKDFEAFVRSGDIERVTIFRPSVDSAWSVYGYGETLPPEVVNMVSLDEMGSKRLWADLDAAYAFIRKSGFSQAIEIDG
jgi:hypothetical protein